MKFDQKTNTKSTYCLSKYVHALSLRKYGARIVHPLMFDVEHHVLAPATRHCLASS